MNKSKAELKKLLETIRDIADTIEEQISLEKDAENNSGKEDTQPWVMYRGEKYYILNDGEAECIQYANNNGIITSNPITEICTNKFPAIKLSDIFRDGKWVNVAEPCNGIMCKHCDDTSLWAYSYETLSYEPNYEEMFHYITSEMRRVTEQFEYISYERIKNILEYVEPDTILCNKLCKKDFDA